MRPEDEQRRGAEAEQLLRNPLVKEFMAVMEGRLISELADINIADEKRLRTQIALAVLKKFPRYLQEVAQTGNLASLDLERKRTLAERMKRFVA